MSAGRQKHATTDSPAGGPVRLCAVLRRQCAPDDLIRFVVSPEGLITPDLACRLPGRGVWISASRDIIAEAVKTKAFQRSLKRAVTVPENLPGLVEGLLAGRCCQTLAIANKAGLLISGFSKVEAAISRARLVALLHGTDAAEDGTAKLDRKFRAIEADKGRDAQILRCLTIAELSLALGRPNVVHAGLTPGGASVRVVKDAVRLRRYRSGFGTSPTSEAPQVAKVEHG